MLLCKGQTTKEAIKKRKDDGAEEGRTCLNAPPSLLRLHEPVNHAHRLHDFSHKIQIKPRSSVSDAVIGDGSQSNGDHHSDSSDGFNGHGGRRERGQDDREIEDPRNRSGKQHRTHSPSNSQSRSSSGHEDEQQLRKDSAELL